MGGEDPVVLAHERRHERREEVHADLQPAGPEAVGDVRDRGTDHMALGLEIGLRDRIHEGESARRLIAGDIEEVVAPGLDFRLDRLYVNTFRLIAFHAARAAAAEHAAGSAHEGLRADPVQEHAVKAAVAEKPVVDGDDAGGVLRVRRAVEAEALARGQVETARDLSPQVHGRGILADLLRLGEDGKPKQHADVLPMQVLAHLPVNLLVQAPSDDDLLDRNHAAHRVEATDNLLRRILRRRPSAQRHLDDIPRLRSGFPLAGRHGQQAKHQKDNPFHISRFKFPTNLQRNGGISNGPESGFPDPVDGWRNILNIPEKKLRKKGVSLTDPFK